MGKRNIAVCNKIKAVKYKLITAFPNMPEGRMMCAVVIRALEDAHNIGLDSHNFRGINKPKIRLDAWQFLNGDIWPAEVSGVNSDYVKRIISDSGIDMESLLDDIQRELKRERLRHV